MNRFLGATSESNVQKLVWTRVVKLSSCVLLYLSTDIQLMRSRYFRAPIAQRSKNLIAELTQTSHAEALFFQLQWNMLLLSAKDLIKALRFILDKL